MENYLKFLITIIVLILIINYYIKKNYEGFQQDTPQDDIFFNKPLYDSGADMRFFGTTFTGSNQGKANNLPIPGYLYS